MWKCGLVVLVACGGTGGTGSREPLSLASVFAAGETVEYVRYVPPTARPAPTLLLIHGAGGHAEDMVAAWRGLADSENLVLIAPELSLTAEQETRVVELLSAIVDAACVGIDVDRSRSYVFGYSAGGYFAFDAAALLSNRFAAVAVFASTIAPEYAAIVEHAARKTPIALYLGDHDRYWSLAQGRATRDLLVDHGFPVHYVELRGQGHDYSRIAPSLDADAWHYLAHFTLSSPTRPAH